MVGKGNLAVIESSGISETGEVTPTKLQLHVHFVRVYSHKLL